MRGRSASSVPSSGRTNKKAESAAKSEPPLKLVAAKPAKSGAKPGRPRAGKAAETVHAESVLEAAVRKPVAVAVEVRSGIGTGGAGAAVALQRTPEPAVAVLEFDDPILDEESELDEDLAGEPASFSSTLGLRSTHPFEQLNAARDYDPTAAMTPEERRAMRDQVVIEHLPLVRAIAVRVHENLPVHVELDDLVHAGIMGLFDASSKYNPEKRVAFSSYAKHRIKGAILDSLRQLDWASRDLRRRHKQIEQVTRDLASTLHRNPTEEEVAGKMGVEVDRWRQMMLDLRNVGLISASTRGTEHDDLPAPDFPAKAELQPDSMCAYEQLKELLGTAMQALPERYKKVVLMYYKSELTMKEIGQHLGINESRVSQIHKSALEKMANALQQAGIASSQAF